ncbi:MAG: hypothetical protein AAF420_14770 [Pseudomonadota bacterium]
MNDTVRDDNSDPLGDIISFSRRCALVIVIAAFASYALAYYVWTLGQSIGAVVIATMGFLVFRSLRKIVFNLTWQKFNQKPEHRDLVERFDSRLLTRREKDIRAHFEQDQANIETTP